MYKKISLLILFLFSQLVVIAQNEPPKYEMRGIWMASVGNLDWPASGLSSVSSQKQDLIEKLDKLKSTGINLVFFQVRTEGDALYNSEIEPWSRYLTGTEGEAPDPLWDPLAFAVEEAHKRGMELHAWLNPYRAMISVPSDFTQKRAFSNKQELDEHLASFLAKEENLNAPLYKRDTSQRDEKHVSNTHPEWLLIVNEFAIFDPGLPEVMDYTTEVVMDIVNRYDIDGIHFDDYFYPYPQNHMESSPAINALDDDTFAEYPRGFDNKNDWRRNNINMLIEMIYDSINVVKPWVEFGISPFGIWKNGTPPGVYGMSSYSSIYADALAWLRSQSIDYINPQLYWKIGGNQDFIRLSNWWADSAAHYNRHMYAGHGAYKTDGSTFTGAQFSASEMPRQIRHTRNNDDIGGSVFFRTKNITNYSTKGFADSLKNNYYRFSALPPIMDWKDQTAPATPQNLIAERDTENDFIINLSWNAVDFTGEAVAGSSHQDTLVKYAVYRVDSSVEPNKTDAMMIGSNLIAVTGTNSFTDIAPPSANDHYYFVTAVSRNSIESPPSSAENIGMVEAGKIVLGPENVTIDPTMTFTPKFSAFGTDDTERWVPRNKITWSLTNEEIGEINENGTFTPSAVGETGIVGTLNVASDTVWVSVTQHDEVYVTLDKFEALDDWNITADKLDENQYEVISLENGGIQIKYTLAAKSSGAKIYLENDIAVDGVPGYANIKSSGDGSDFGMTIDISNADGQFRMNNKTMDFSAPDVIHYKFNKGNVSTLTSGADFYFPFSMNKITISLPSNGSEETVEGFVNIFEVGVSYTDTPVSNEEQIAELPNAISLDQNYPNPFNPITQIAFEIPFSDRVQLKIYDIIGREIQTLVDGKLNTGRHVISFNAANLSSGVYIYRLQVGDNILSKKMTLIK